MSTQQQISPDGTDDMPSARTPYLGSAVEYDVVLESNLRVPMRDGVELATDVYRPANGTTPVLGTFPTIVERTCYDRTRVDLGLTARYFASRGYNFVLQDVRGRYGSDGDFFFFFNPQPEGQDGFDCVEWIAAQPWSDGKVGTTGLSFTGSNQQALALEQPPHLTTQVILDAGYNYWQRPLRHAGAFTEGITFPYALWMALAGKEARQDPSIRDELRAALSDTETWRRWLPAQAGETPLALAPSYEAWYLAMANTTDYEGIWKNEMSSLEEHIDRYPDIPICLVTSWYGHHAQGNFDKWDAMRRKNQSPVRLVAGHWLHWFDYMEQTWAGDVEFSRDSAIRLDDFRLAWFDRWLKGLPTGARTDGASIYVMGGGDGSRDVHGRYVHGGHWQEIEAWPAPGTQSQVLRLGPNGVLAADTVTGEQSFVFDPDDPVPSVGGALQNPPATTGWINGGAFDQRNRSDLVTCTGTGKLADRPDVLAFRTEVLAHDLVVTGPVTVELYVSTTALDTDFTVKLVDEAPPSEDFPEGFDMNIGDTIMRLRYRNRRSAQPVDPGEIYHLEFLTLPVANTFQAGHRLRLDVSSSNFPQFDINPNTGAPLGTKGPRKKCRNTIYFGAEHPSSVRFPFQTANSGAQA